MNEEKLSDLERRTDRIVMQMEMAVPLLKRLRDAIDGTDNDPGLRTAIATLCVRLEAIEADAQARRNMRNGITVAMVSSFIATVLGGVAVALGLEE